MGGFIYTWQAIWIIYVLFLTCKYSMNDIIFGKWFYILYNVGNIFNGIWLIIWTNEYIVPAALCLICIAASLVSAAYIAHKYMFVHLSKMRRVDSNYGGVSDQDPDDENNKTTAPKWLQQSKVIKPLIYVFVLNGVPFYATWTVVATHLNVGVALCYKGGMTNTNASILMLSILTCVILFYWFLDFYRFRNYLQYTYSPYIILIVAFCGILTNGGLDAEERPSSVFTLILLIVAVIGTICKVIMGVCMRSKPVE